MIFVNGGGKYCIVDEIVVKHGNKGDKHDILRIYILIQIRIV